jgi:hypothetical protein
MARQNAVFEQSVNAYEISAIPRGMHWVNQLSHAQLAINAVSGNSTGSSLFKIIYGQKFCLLPSVRIYSTNLPSTDKHVTSLMKVQQEVHKASELTRVHQTRVSQDHLKPAPPPLVLE